MNTVPTFACHMCKNMLMATSSTISVFGYGTDMKAQYHCYECLLEYDVSYDGNGNIGFVSVRDNRPLYANRWPYSTYDMTSTRMIISPTQFERLYGNALDWPKELTKGKFHPDQLSLVCGSCKKGLKLRESEREGKGWKVLYDCDDCNLTYESHYGPRGGTRSVECHGMDLKEIAGSVIGYRGWKLENWKLCSSGVTHSWDPGINEARCRKNYEARASHPAPASSCDCGLYALSRFTHGSEWWNPESILGAVEAWADVDEEGQDRFFLHATGFRSQYAKIVLLATSDEYPRAKNAAIRALAEEYGADTCRRDHLQDAAKEHGQLVPDELLEWAKG